MGNVLIENSNLTFLNYIKAVSSIYGSPKPNRSDVRIEIDSEENEIQYIVSGNSVNINSSSNSQITYKYKINGYYAEPVKIQAEAITLKYEITEHIYQKNPNSWIFGSDIGSLDFELKKNNIAFRLPLQENNYIYALHKLGNKVIAYGDNSITALIPNNKYWGKQKIIANGIKSKGAVVATPNSHYFVSSDDILYRLSEEGIEELGYSEFIKNLEDIVMIYNPLQQSIYISSKNKTYIYRINYGMGAGYNGITGFAVFNGIPYAVASSSSIEYSNFYIKTDIFDFGTRAKKMLYSASITYNAKNDVILEAKLYYRKSYDSKFEETDWIEVKKNGVVNFHKRAVEFMLAFRSKKYIDNFAIDNILIEGAIIQYDYKSFARRNN